MRPVTAHKRRRRARKRSTLAILSFDAVALVNSIPKGRTSTALVGKELDKTSACI